MDENLFNFFQILSETFTFLHMPKKGAAHRALPLLLPLWAASQIVGILHGHTALFGRARVAAVFVIGRAHLPYACLFSLHSLDFALAFAPFCVLLEQHLPPEALLLCALLEEVSLLFFMLFLLILYQTVSGSRRAPCPIRTADTPAMPRLPSHGIRIPRIPTASVCPAYRGCPP